ncbi:Wadjet anti-phage system protein JetA family protein [Rhodospirillum centenum]|uniref:Uncharacterized protein n=1 Tax=Rhodospirillum centenum (strain ATCC 51521 / SW) TaxID=414684 RepID=B6IX12_RHOCS|nr:Wadjet anti-phage system protein JetA family protein [Rhodospirillum centenum]ACJ00836.1 conserved hypothetical protein [Rhodospirillum centenum SW]
MSLFGELHEDAFLLFSRANRHLYAQLVTDLFERFFSDTVTFPNRLEVVGYIYDLLRNQPELWADDGEDWSGVADVRTTGRRIRRARPEDRRQDLLLDCAYRAYGRLIDTGWLEEESYGLKITVDMPPAAMLLAERLAAIQRGLATSFRGVVVTIRNALAAVVNVDGRVNAVGLNKAAEMAVRFSRELRAVLSSLRSIERDILASESLNERLATFVQDFIGKLVLKDFESIYKTNHPYRFKHEILGYVDAISDEGYLRDQIIDGYVEGEVSLTRSEAGLQLDQDLFTIRNVFDNVDQTYDRINVYRVRLEGRLRNVLKYAELGDHRHSQRVTGLTARLDRVLTGLGEVGMMGWLDDRQPRGFVLPEVTPWAPHLLAQPRAPKPPVEATAVRRQQFDPVLAAFRRLLRDYNDLFVVETARVLRFLDCRVPPGCTGEARWLSINGVEDFLVFEQLRRLRYKPSSEFAQHYEILPCPEGAWRDDEWIRCKNFLIRTKIAGTAIDNDA